MSSVYSLQVPIFIAIDYWSKWFTGNRLFAINERKTTLMISVCIMITDNNLLRIKKLEKIC